MFRKELVCLSVVLISLASVANAKSKGFLDFNLYPYLMDVDNDSVFTVNASLIVNNRFSYFSLTNFINESDKDALSEVNGFYSEQNIRWKVAEDSAFDLTYQANFRSGNDNDRHRLGIRWRFNDFDSFKQTFDSINLKYAINLHAIQIDNEEGNIWQLEHAFFLTLPSISEQLYVAGFIDHTFGQELPSNFPSAPIVGEVQLGYQFVDDFYLVAEYRVNEYRREDVNNLALGIQFKSKW